MTGLEIFTAISEKKKEIENIYDPTTFVLNPKVQELEKEISDLQNKCPHNYIGKVCEFCGKEEVMNIILYKSAACPQCKVVKMKLDKKGLLYTEKLTDNMTPAELAEAGIKGIPTMFVNGEKMTNLREMTKWIDSQEV